MTDNPDEKEHNFYITRGGPRTTRFSALLPPHDRTPCMWNRAHAYNGYRMPGYPFKLWTGIPGQSLQKV